jgi:hypothetical protein
MSLVHKLDRIKLNPPREDMSFARALAAGEFVSVRRSTGLLRNASTKTFSIKHDVAGFNIAMENATLIRKLNRPGQLRHQRFSKSVDSWSDRTLGPTSVSASAVLVSFSQLMAVLLEEWVIKFSRCREN